MILKEKKCEKHFNSFPAGCTIFLNMHMRNLQEISIRDYFQNCPYIKIIIPYAFNFVMLESGEETSVNIFVYSFTNFCLILNFHNSAESANYFHWKTPKRVSSSVG